LGAGEAPEKGSEFVVAASEPVVLCGLFELDPCVGRFDLAPRHPHGDRRSASGAEAAEEPAAAAGFRAGKDCREAWPLGVVELEFDVVDFSAAPFLAVNDWWSRRSRARVDFAHPRPMLERMSTGMAAKEATRITSR
jgi:hypothetical protein